jgi:positive control factor
VKKLIKEYRDTLRCVNRAKAKATNPEDRSLLASCADSLQFSIKYMEMGKNPNSRRGITRLSGMQREIPVDPHNVAFVRAAVLQSQAPEISEKMRRAIVDLEIVLRGLSEKEQEAYSLVRGSGYSFAAAAVIMDVQKGTVQTLVRRAEDKIHDMVVDLTDRGIVFKRDIQLEVF